VKIGDTFVWCPTRVGIAHLWILISDPSLHGGKCVLLNLTESSHATHSFTLRPGQHRYIYKDSDVNFGDAIQTSEAELKAKMTIGDAQSHDSMDSAIVKEIIKAAHTHPAFQPILRKFLPPVS
jgi:hypothetical protein